MKNLLKDIDNISDKKIILGGDLNLVFDCNLEACGGNPVLKKKSLTKFIEIKESLNLCDISRIRNPKFKRYTFRQNHSSGFIQRRLDYFFVSNVLQERVKKTDILASFATDHSPILFSLNQMSEFSHGKGLWKFNKSLLLNKEYVEKIKEHILLTIKMLDNDDLRDEQVRWEYLKYEIRKFTIRFSKNLAKEVRKETQSLEEKVKHFESSVTNYHNDLQYIEYKERLNTIYSKKVNGIQIRSKCDWYESGEKSTKFFLNLEKSRSSQGVVRSILKNKIEVKNQSEINNELYKFYKNLFKENLNTSKGAIFLFL